MVSNPPKKAARSPAASLRAGEASGAYESGRTEPSEEQHAEKRALTALRRWAGSLVWRMPTQQADGRRVDIVGSDARGKVITVEVKALRGSNRVDALKGAAAMAILDLQRWAPELHKLAWIEVERLGSQAVGKLAEYLREVAPEVGWAVVDLHGGVRIHAPTIGLDVRVESDAAPPRSGKAFAPLFSDLNAWMLKVLLMRRAPEWAWTATREPCRNAHVLHSVAEVSGASAHRFVKAMTEADYLRSDRKGLQLVRIESLLNHWRAIHQNQPPVLIEARPLFDWRPRDLGLSLLGGRVALGGQYAAEQFEMQHATRGRATIWIEADLERALDAMDLVPAEPGRGRVWVGRPRHVESCFRARVITDGVAYIDPCELMLEAAMDPARGFEQSEYVLQRIVAWQGPDEADE